MKHTRDQKVFMAVFLAPALILYTGLMAIPAANALGYSLYKWDGLTDAVFVGLHNFGILLRDTSLFLRALWHNVFLMMASGAGILFLSLTFAALIHRRIRGATLFRVTFFFPNVLSSVAIALLWILLYSATDFGIVNAFLVKIGVLNAPFPFTVSRYLIYSIVPMIVWTATGFYMVLFLAAMEGIPETYYEAATLDGATGIQQFRHITLPLIREVVTVGMVFLVIGSLKMFDAIWVMENQWPREESHVLATLLYQKVFSEYDVGYGSAVAVVLFVLVFLATLATLRLSRREALEY